MTNPDQRTYDVFEGGGHADFIRYVATKGEIPAVGTGWEYHQPPLYYIFSALLYLLTVPEGGRPALEIFQGMNWVIFQIFVVVGLKIINENFRDRFSVFALCTFALWPMNMFHAARIGNDNLSYLMASLAILYFLRYSRDGRSVWLLFSLTYLATGAFVKSSVLPVGACMGLMSLHYLYRRYFFLQEKGRLKEHLTAISVLAMIALAPLFPKFIYYFSNQLQGSESLLFPGIQSNIGLSIPIHFTNFIPFYSLTGAFEPFVSPWEDRTGRNNFWTYLFKSAMTGEMSSGSAFSRTLGYIYLCGSYVLLAVSIKGLISPKVRNTIFTLLCSLSCIALMASTINQNNACNQDFRYIYYITIPLSISLGLGIRAIAKWSSLFFMITFLTLIAGNLLVLRIAYLSYAVYRPY